MSTDSVNDSSEFQVNRLVSFLAEGVVLLPCEKGMKGPRGNAWPKTTIEKMRDPKYIRKLACAGGIAVLTGEPSNRLCSIDIDDDEMIEPFLAVNPLLRQTLCSRGPRGCNLWVRIEGVYPRPCDIKQPDECPWGEWRANVLHQTRQQLHMLRQSHQRDVLGDTLCR